MENSRLKIEILFLCTTNPQLPAHEPVTKQTTVCKGYCSIIYTVKPGQRAKAEEKELKNEIIELEKTFENLDLDNSIGGGSINSTYRKPLNRGLYR